MRAILFFILFFSGLYFNISNKNSTELTCKGISENNTLNTVVFPQPLAGCDELGRILPDNKVTGNPKTNRQVGIFYFLWQGDKSSPTSKKHWDLSKIITDHPEVLKQGKNEYWGTTGRGSYYFWGKPIYGYYKGDDYWVHLKNIQLLTDAGIDFLVIDATNTLIYPEQSNALMQAILTVQNQSRNPPKIVYYTNTESGKTMQEIYNTFYKPEAPFYFPTCWYYFEGKPLIIGITKEAEGTAYESFFTFRESQWPNESIKANGWPWIDFQRPQHAYVNKAGEREIINVSVAQHPNPSAGMGGSAFYGNLENWGRSYRNNSHGNPETDITHGYNFQEQWDFALEQDVPFIFITGWNEWIAGRWQSTDGNPEHSFFCDQASPEYSRDIEPTRTAGLNDNYYLQMVANIRRYKGMNPVQKAGNEKSIKGWNDWEEITPIYTDYKGDTEKRDHPSAVINPHIQYTNTTGRNDFTILKVARNKKQIWFYAETVNNISPQTGENWMRLYINVDRNYNTGWYGYDYRVNNGSELQKFVNDRWETITQVKVIQKGNKLMYNFPLKAIFKNFNSLDFEFKWSDNMQEDNPMDWYVNGDVAPESRFNFVYKTK